MAPVRYQCDWVWNWLIILLSIVVSNFHNLKSPMQGDWQLRFPSLVTKSLSMNAQAVLAMQGHHHQLEWKPMAGELGREHCTEEACHH